MIDSHAAVLGTLCLSTALSACYSPNQHAFEASIHDRISIGLPAASAVANLREINMHCTGEGPITCDRIRQRLLPSSCIERVELGILGDVVDTLEIRPIVCAGL